MIIIMHQNENATERTRYCSIIHRNPAGKVEVYLYTQLELE